MRIGLDIAMPTGRGGAQTIGEQLRSFGGLTFYKDYLSLSAGEHTAAELNADISAGSAAATFTAAYSGKTSTWIDDNGVIHQHSGTDNLARVNGGYYDATGFHAYDSNSKRIKGYLPEAAGQNLLTYSNSPSESSVWTYSDLTASSGGGATSPNGSASDLITITAAGSGTRLSFFNVGNAGVTVLASTKYTFSWFIKLGTATSGILYRVYDVSNSLDIVGPTEYTQTTEWTRHTLTFTTPVGCTKVYLYPIMGTFGLCGTVFIWGAQLEPSPSATSFIPTTTASLSRPSETLSYLNSGNRTAAQESIFCRFAPLGGTFANDAVFRFLLDDAEERRRLLKYNTSALLKFESNNIDSPGIGAQTGSPNIINTSSVVGAIPFSSSGDPNTLIYMDGGSVVSSNTDWIAPDDLGTSFYIGSRKWGDRQLGGIISNVAFYSDAKTAVPVASISTILASP